MSERRQVGDRVRLRRGPAYGVLTIADTPHNRRPWSCTGACGDPECREFDDLHDADGPTGVHANECDLEAE